MNFRAIVVLLVVILLALFGAQNWPALTAVPEAGQGARFLWMEVPATPALVLFGAAFAITALFMLLAAQLRTSSLLEARRYSKEVEQARRLADEAEASRFERLRGEMEADRGAFDDLLRREGELTRAKIDALAEALGRPAAGSGAPPAVDPMRERSEPAESNDVRAPDATLAGSGD